MTKGLPKFNNPPVIETVLGVEFKPLQSWQIPHFGLFWNRIRSNYQRFAVQPPLPGQVEKFGNEQNTLTISLNKSPEARCWFFDDNGNWLLQIQNNRFISNWKRASPSYPNYKGFNERFEREWNRFNEFLNTEKLGQLHLLQCEVSYINHIEVNINFDDLGDIFPIWGEINKEGFLPKPEAVGFNTAYVIPENRGRLYVAMQPVVRHSDFKAVIQLAITAKVKIASDNNNGMIEALKLAHEWVVCGFTDFTSDKMHEVWQRKQ
ncbi:MAG: TIGR04255 family protein [Pyrinomonadaceae bacterium]|jgi:uncharacterized protein (TIGR04255 family)